MMHANRSTLNVNDTVIVGDRNTVTGSNNIIIGERNTITGNGNIIIGDRNTITGSNNRYAGDRVTVTGKGNAYDPNLSREDYLDPDQNKKQKTITTNPKSVAMNRGVINYVQGATTFSNNKGPIAVSKNKRVVNYNYGNDSISYVGEGQTVNIDDDEVFIDGDLVNGDDFSMDTQIPFVEPINQNIMGPVFSGTFNGPVNVVRGDSFHSARSNSNTERAREERKPDPPKKEEVKKLQIDPRIKSEECVESK
jgi:hypothetical protein